MKQAGAIFLSLIFLAGAMGLTIHYCGSKLQSVSLIAQGCCCRADESGKIPMDDDCCKNEIIYVKITDDFSPSSQFYVDKTDVALAAYSTGNFSSFVNRQSSFSFNNHSPPQKLPDLVIAFHRLLI